MPGLEELRKELYRYLVLDAAMENPQARESLPHLIAETRAKIAQIEIPEMPPRSR